MVSHTTIFRASLSLLLVTMALGYVRADERDPFSLEVPGVLKPVLWKEYIGLQENMMKCMADNAVETRTCQEVQARNSPRSCQMHSCKRLVSTAIFLLTKDSAKRNPVEYAQNNPTERWRPIPSYLWTADSRTGQAYIRRYQIRTLAGLFLTRSWLNTRLAGNHRLGSEEVSLKVSLSQHASSAEIG